MNLRVSQSQKQTILRGLLYVLGMLILAVGLTLSTKATLGVSPIISIAYCVSELSGVSIGDTTLLLYVVLIAVQVALHSLRKTQKWKQTVLFDLLQLPVSIAFTRFMNLVSSIVPVFEGAYAGSFWGSLYGRVCLLLLAILLTGIGAAITLRMRLVPNPGDGIVQAIADFCSIPVGRTKNYVDLCCLLLSAAISLCFARRLLGIGIGTVLAALGTGRVIALFNKLFAARLDRMTGSA